MVVGKDTLYLYGGMMEIGDKEVNFDDLYSLDLNKLNEWKCIIKVSRTRLTVCMCGLAIISKKKQCFDDYIDLIGM